MDATLQWVPSALVEIYPTGVRQQTSLAELLRHLFFDMHDFSWHPSLTTRAAGRKTRSPYNRKGRLPITREENFYGLRSCQVKVVLILLFPQQLIVNCIVCEYSHYINELLKDGKAWRYTSTIFFEPDVEENMERERLASMYHLVLVHAAMWLRTPVQQLVA